MSQTGQTPRNGLAKLLWEAESDDDPQEIASQMEQFVCPGCGWEADLRRNECMICDWDQPLKPASTGGRGGDA